MENEKKQKKKNKVKQVKKSKGLGLRSIKAKIMMAIIATSILISIFIASTVLLSISSNFKNDAIDRTDILVAKFVNNFEQSFVRLESSVKTFNNSIASEFDYYQAKKDILYVRDFRDKTIPTVHNLAKDFNLSDSVYIYFNPLVFDKAFDIWYKKDGDKFRRQAQIEYDYYQTDQDHPDKAWFFAPVNSKEAQWTKPYISTQGELISSYVSPVIVDGDVIAIVGMDLNLQVLKDELLSEKLFDTGYLYMADQQGNVLIHKSLKTGSNLYDSTDSIGNEDLEKILSTPSGFEILNIHGEDTIVSYLQMNNGWYILSDIPEKEVMALITKVIFNIVFIAIISIVVSMIIAAIVGGTISRPIVHMQDKVTQVKDGDFTVQAKVKSRDEVRFLADGLNDMIAQIRTLIDESKQVSHQVSESASILASTAEETSATSDEVARTVTEIANGASSQANDAERGAIVASALDSKFVQLESDSSIMAESADNIKVVSEHGVKALSLLKESSDVAKVSNEEISSAVNNLSSRLNAISSIIDAITAISEQTNLLALNASIEAARAGEAGKGFAVVADEIRKLAEGSSTSADEIRTLLESILKESQDTVSAMDKVSEITVKQEEAIDGVNSSFDEVFAAINTISQLVDKVGIQIKDLSHDKNEIVSAIENISAVSEETAAASEEVSASMDQQATAVEEVAKSAELLNELSIQLNEQLSNFKVD